MLTELVPDVRKGADAIAAAQLPGILREKEPAWKAGVERLQGVVTEYERAAAAKNKKELLDAAEKLHSGYESLVRIIRPPLKELESFHSQLYVLYHYYMPKDTLAGITSAVKELKVRMVSLNKAVLPSRLAGRQEAFDHARADLSTSLDALAATLPSNDLTHIKPAIEKMHGCYEALAKVLE